MNEWMNEWMNKLSEWALSYGSTKVFKMLKITSTQPGFCRAGEVSLN